MSDRRQTSNELERSIGRLEGKLDAMIVSVQGLSASFDSLEKGRLSRLEIAFAELKTSTTDAARSTAFWTSALIGIVVSIVVAAIIKVLKI